MSGRLRVLAAALLLLGASSVVEAQHAAKPQAGHGTPAEKAPAHGDAKPAKAETKPAASAHDEKPAAAHAEKPAEAHADKPAGAASNHAGPVPPAPKSAAPRAPAPSSAAHAVARVMEALDRELGKPGTRARAPRRPPASKPGRIAVSWKLQVEWPEGSAHGDTLRVTWPEPVLESAPLRFSYIGLPK